MGGGWGVPTWWLVVRTQTYNKPFGERVGRELFMVFSSTRAQHTKEGWHVRTYRPLEKERKGRLKASASSDKESWA